MSFRVPRRSPMLPARCVFAIALVSQHAYHFAEAKIYTRNCETEWGEAMQKDRILAILFIFGVGVIPFGQGPTAALAQAPSRQTAESAGKTAPANDLQRSVKIYSYKAAAESGATRGEVIYYYKCWVCHNDYTRAAGSPAPSLKDLYKRPKLVSGEPVNDDTVSKQIRDGSAGMPALRNTLSDICCHGTQG